MPLLRVAGGQRHRGRHRLLTPPAAASASQLAATSVPPEVGAVGATAPSAASAPYLLTPNPSLSHGREKEKERI
jgi:hypothetical protein